MKKLLCLLMAFCLFFAVGCKKQAGRLVKDFVANEAADTVVKGVTDGATNSGGKNATGSINANPGNTTGSVPGKSSPKSKAGMAAAVVGGAVAALATSNTDLSLGEIFIGQSESDVQSIMGKPMKVTDPDNTGHLRYKYTDMVVVITNGIVTGFVSDTAAVSTKRGIKQGDKLDKVMREYGKPYAESNFEDTTLYEYKFTSDLKQECLLRFAIKNANVDYISARVL